MTKVDHVYGVLRDTGFFNELLQFEVTEDDRERVKRYKTDDIANQRLVGIVSSRIICRFMSSFQKSSSYMENKIRMESYLNKVQYVIEIRKTIGKENVEMDNRRFGDFNSLLIKLEKSCIAMIQKYGDEHWVHTDNTPRKDINEYICTRRMGERDGKYL